MISIRDCTYCPLQKKKIWVGISTVSQVQQWHKPHFWLTNKFVKHCIFFPSFLADLVDVCQNQCKELWTFRVRQNQVKYTIYFELWQVFHIKNTFTEGEKVS